MAKQVLVIDYTTSVVTIDSTAQPSPRKETFLALIRDINTAGHFLSRFDGIGMDSLAPLATEALDFVVAMNSRRDTQIQDYKIAIAKLGEVLNGIFSFGKNFVLTAHLQSETDQVTGRGRVVPQVWGKDLPSDIPKKFSEVFQTQTVPNPKTKNGVDYRWLTRPDGFINFLGSRLRDDLDRSIEQDFSKLTDGGLKRIRALIVGESHTGKTRSIGTLPGDTVLLFALEPDGWESLRVPFTVIKPPLSEVWK
jgi:hypothetical protein